MRFVCDSCRAQYMISDDKIGAKGVKIRCKKCGHVIVVRPSGASAPKDEGAPAAEATAAASNGAAGSNAAGGLASLGTPPEGGLFTDVEEDEIGAVFDQVLSGSQKMPGGESAREAKPTTPEAVRKLAEAEDEPDEPKAEAPPNDWYVAIDEKQVGPLSVEKVKEHWERGEVGPDSLCWRQGYGDWIPLSEVKELASVLSPRPAKPVIVAPSPVSTSVPAVSAPVESAFSAGAAPKNTRPEIPAAPALGVEPVSSGWKPSAASVLASLVKEENEALSKPPPKPAAEEKQAPGLLDLPPPEPAPAPARASPMMAAAAEPMRAPQPAAMPYAPSPAPAYAQPAPAYAQPAPAYAGYPQPSYPGYPPAAGAGQQGGGNKTVMIAGIAVAVVALLGVGGFLVFGRSPPPAEPVAVADARPTPPAPAPTPVSPPPEVKAQPAANPATPPPAAAQGTTPGAPGTAAAPGTPAAPGTQPGATTPPAVAAATPAPTPVTPPATTPTPPPATAEATKPNSGTRTERPGSSSRPSSSSRQESKTEAVAKPEPATKKSDDGLDDDFDDLFGKKEKKETKSNSGSSSSVYIPPEPGSGSNVQDKLGQSDIMAVVVANKPAIMKCVGEQRKRDPDISGKLVMHWTIQTSGKTSGVSVVSDEFKKTYMASCITGLIKGWTFPKHKKQGDPIDFPFTF
ncbi:adventurous gliding motility protein GltJ [Hyalangium versicolor]|uniref:adventurous gliding motility protein GltJ n=1 Tax=Hyalangium versicolor TaxID=2861190 RepID=UPI001CCA4C44|nr:adventurous gliding motility protein GltJ [Hyalangium versicolor]